MDTAVEKNRVDISLNKMNFINGIKHSHSDSRWIKFNNGLLPFRKPWMSFYCENPVSFYTDVSSQIFIEDYATRDIVRDIIKLLSWKI